MAAPMRLCGQRMEKIVTDFPINYPRKWRTLKLILFLGRNEKILAAGRGRGPHMVRVSPGSGRADSRISSILAKFSYSDLLISKV